MRLSASVDTEQLPPETAASIRQALERVDLDALDASGITAQGADRFQYDLIVRLGDKRKQASFGETAMPDELRPVIDLLIATARGE